MEAKFFLLLFMTVEEENSMFEIETRGQYSPYWLQANNLDDWGHKHF